MLTDARDMAAAGDLERALEAGRESPRRGPSVLPALREAGVVDAGGDDLAPVIAALAEGAELVTVLRGEDAPRSDEEIRALAPAAVEVEVTPGAPPPWWWLLAAE